MVGVCATVAANVGSPVRWWLRHIPLYMQSLLRIILRTNELKNSLLAAA